MSPVLTLDTVEECHKSGMQNGNWGALVSVITEFHLACWFVNFTHREQSPLLPTYFLFRSDTLCLHFQPILIPHPLSFAPVGSPYHFPLSTPSPLLTHSQDNPISLVACARQFPSSPLRKPSAMMSPLGYIPHLGIRIPSQSCFHPFPRHASAPPYFSVGMSTESEGSLGILLRKPPEPLSQNPLGLTRSPECLLGGCRSCSAPLQS